MKALTILIAAFSVAAVVVLSRTQVDPIYACPGNNTLYATANTFTSETDGTFAGSFDVTGWAVTSAPVGLNFLFDDDYTGQVNIASASYTPTSYYVGGRPCEWMAGSPSQYYSVDVEGTVTNQCEEGNLQALIQVGGFGLNFTAPLACHIPDC
jgi:hypothetical protein